MKKVGQERKTNRIVVENILGFLNRKVTKFKLIQRFKRLREMTNLADMQSLKPPCPDTTKTKRRTDPHLRGENSNAGF